MKSRMEKLIALILSGILALEEDSAEQRKQRLEQKQREKEARQKVAELFPADDVRSKALLYDYAFEGGKFSRNKDAYPNCQGVVGWINPDPKAREGDRVYVVLSEQQNLQYSNKDNCEVGADDLYDGRFNTQKLIEYSKGRNFKFPAAMYAYCYVKNGVKKGEAFLPAKKQLERVVENCDGVKKALKLIGGTFEGWLWSSSEYDDSNAWYVGSFDGDMIYLNKTNTISVSCFLAY